MKILIIEHEHDLTRNMVRYLRNDSYVCDIAHTAVEAIEKVLVNHYDCILIDIALSDGNGVKVLETVIKYKKENAIIVITPESVVPDSIPGFDSAEDFLVKPFPLHELTHKVSATIRRQKFGPRTRLELGNISIDLLGKEVSVGDTEVRLTRKEYDLLLFLASQQNRVISKNAIAEHLGNEGSEAVDNFDFIYSHMKNLKKKLVEAGGKSYIRTMYGVGYKFSV
jgi:DNA-binding response OmpR family regulator